MILTDRVAAGVFDGRITVAFRRWKVARVSSGSTFHSTAGLVKVGDVSVIAENDITEEQAIAAGASTVDELVRGFRGTPDDPIFRIELASAGADPRVELGDDHELSEEDRITIDRRLARLDGSSKRGAWTMRTLRLIEQHPAEHAESLRGDVDKEVFKRDVRKLKNLGLTRSLPEGYELSPRGSAYLSER